MPTSKTPSPRVAAVLVATLALLLGVAGLVAGSPAAGAATAGSLQQRISAGQGRVSALSGALGAARRRASRLGASVATLQRRVDSLQADLNAKRSQLLKLQDELTSARVRLVKLQAEQAHTESVLSSQLVGSYESDRPDLVSVVLESTGFNNLLERLDFASRVGHQDAQIVGQVKAARRAVAAQAVQLGHLTVRQQQLTTAVLAERNSVDRTRLSLVRQQIGAIRVRDARAGQLSSARSSLVSLRGQLRRLQAAQAAAARREAARAAAPAPAPSSGSGGSTGSPAPAPAPAPHSGGGFSFPLPISAAAPPSAWSLDDGVDISAPGGTPEYAVCSGTVVLHGIGGFGPSAPVIHCDSPISGYDYVYYGHAGPGNWVPVGAHVSQGQVVSQVGYGIVGISSGPHLEIGFANSSGGPIGPSSAPAMAALLHASY